MSILESINQLLRVTVAARGPFGVARPQGTVPRAEERRRQGLERHRPEQH
jgi:hypothetical protein